MKEIHILVTGVGRRVELMQAFKQAALKLNVNLKLYGADITGTAPALTYCDYTRKVCVMRDPQYIQQLIDICIDDKIDLLLLDSVISTYEQAVRSQNISVKKAYENMYNMRHMYEQYSKLSREFMKPYVKESDSKE